MMLAVLVLAAIGACQASQLIMLDDTMGLGRTFNGIGGLSAGGISKLLMDYAEPRRGEILDYLFKPNFGASLHILKVEIGGDAQAADATEASHMHNSSDLNFDRGFEWWLMKEAKARNPNIKLYGLPWAFPGWLGNGTGDPYNDPSRLANYIVKWVHGAKTHHGLDIDYIGIWNEKPYNIAYMKTLRKMLDDSFYEKTRIVAADGMDWSFVDDLTQDAELDSVVDVLGVHYPGTVSPASAVNLGKPLWSSEDYSTYNDNSGGGCLARILNQNYVNGLMTSTIAWGLVDSAHKGLPWDRDALMEAREPWSGHYVVRPPVWAAAHTAQFSSPGWSYLRHGYGVGRLDGGGSIVSLVSPDSSQLTIIIETMSHDNSKCIRPTLPPYSITRQNITLQLMGSFVDIQSLNVWYTKLLPNSSSAEIFQKLSPLQVKSGQAQLTLEVDEVYTLTTITAGQKGLNTTVPNSLPFQMNYFSSFYTLNDSSNAPYFMAQQGVFEVVSVSDWEKRLRQTVLEPPIPWCPTTTSLNATLNIIGNYEWSDIYVRTDAEMVPVNGSNGVFIAARISLTGCDTYRTRGLFFFLYPNDHLFLLTKDIAGSEIITGGRNPGLINEKDNMMELLVYKGYVSGKVNKGALFNVTIPGDAPYNGFVGLGTDSYGYADFDYLDLSDPSDPHESKKDRNLYISKEFY